ncbi:MAG TPA: molybdenum cofactor guanylyltransferase [Acidimicrobiales bacterium]|nr:molybdenum cofactor guanylyltransferase [Acidimicrobiales bacterium]
MTDGARFVGAVLAGGRSRRMGRDKATIRVDGRALASLAVEALVAAGAGRVLVIGGPVPSSLPGAEHVSDDHPGEGPLGGIITALRHGGAPVVVVLACDLPAADPDAVTAVVETLLDHPRALAAVPVTAGGRREVLHAAWRLDALGPLEVAFAAGERAPRRALLRLPVAEVEGLDPRSLTGVNTPDELAAWEGKNA